VRNTYTTFDTPVGTLLATADGASLTGLSFCSGRRPAVAAALEGRRDNHVFARLRAQLTEYFAGERRGFDLPLAPRGTEWELRVWRALLEIPYGETRSYGEIAREVCTVRAARAVGLANARNPIAVVVPCHRVIGADGSLTGYGGGLERKRFLLDLESGRAPLTPISEAP
jgi:methylated-DNA-[protein]-cysteine S-methyltransferase